MADSENTGRRYPLVFRTLAGSFLLLQVAVIAAVIFIAAGGGARKAVAQAEKERATPVRIYEVTPKDVDDVAEFPAVVESWATVNISAEVSGPIVFIGADKGQRIEAGQAIVRIDDAIYRGEKKKAEAAKSFAAQNFDRQKKLFEAKSVSEKDIQESESLMSGTEAEYEIASTNLEKCEIRSPVSGILDDRNIEMGEYVQPGTHICKIEQVDRVKVVFFMPEKDINCVKVGDSIPFTLDSCPGRGFSGNITYVAMSADRASLSFRVEIEAANPDWSLRPGMIARVGIRRRTMTGVPVVPLIAIIPRYEGHYVFVVDEKGRARFREVKIGHVFGKSALVAKGLAFGEKVIVEGQRLLGENDAVLVIGDGLRP